MKVVPTTALQVRVPNGANLVPGSVRVRLQAEAEGLDQVFLAGDPSVGGPFGILQPRPTAPPVEPDIILVPLIAVDGRGTRLGRGKGHYDRVLAPYRRKGAQLIGVGWAVQRIRDEIPRDPWDVPLDSFASPEGLERLNP